MLGNGSTLSYSLFHMFRCVFLCFLDVIASLDWGNGSKYHFVNILSVTILRCCRKTFDLVLQGVIFSLTDIFLGHSVLSMN